MDNTLRDRLRRLGVNRGREGLKPKPAARDGQRATRELIPGGREVASSAGSYYVVERQYALSDTHGNRALGDVLSCAPHVAARLSRNAPLVTQDLSRLAFLDIETTGLGGGAGTLAFLIGVAVIDDGHLLLKQFFLRNPAEEAALLEGLVETLHDRAALVTYNGRGFDVPIVQSRFMLARRNFDLAAYPNLDLLPAARRLWRGRFENCSLGTLEVEVLGLQRTEADVPGYLIPQLYVDYLRTGDAGEMQRVIYHNAEDILSMVTLAAHILDTFADPVSEARSGLDCLRLAMWHDDQGEVPEADAAYQAALSRLRGVPAAHRPMLYERYGAFLKRLNRRAEAAPLWEEWATLNEDDPSPCIELAKFYEWDERDLSRAKEWAARALVCVSHWKKGWARDEAWAEIQHRLERLGRKG